MPKYPGLFVFVVLLMRVLTAAPLLAAQPTPPRARIVEELRLDAKKEDFPSISGLTVGPQRQIAVSIEGDGQIRLYNAIGKRIGAVGRKGQGPGEFLGIGGETWKADTLVVDDNQQRRTTLIASSGKVLRTTFYPTMKSVQLPSRRIDGLGTQNQLVMGTAPDGSQLANWHEQVAKPTPLQRAFGGPMHVVRIMPDGNARAIFNASDYMDERWAIEASGIGDMVPFTFTPTTVTSTTGDRIGHLWSHPTSREGGTFVVSVYHPTGDTVFVRTFPFRGVAISNAARESVLEEVSDGHGSEGGNAATKSFREQARQKIPLAYPGVEGIVLGLDTTVWVTLRATAEGNPVLVLNGKGDPVATVMVPRNARLRQASATQVWMTEKDSDGLVSVVRYKVSGISCGATAC